MRIITRARIAVVLGLGLLTACGAQRSGDVASGPGGQAAIAVSAVDTTFEPARIELEAGDAVEIEVTNEGATTHDFTIEALDLSTGPLDPGDVATATLTVPQGETAFRCTIHGGMDGTIVGV